MNDYLKGTLTGASLVLCIFMLGCPNNQSQDLGHITVKSIKVLNGEGEECFWVGSAPEGNGYLTVSNADGELTAHLGGDANGDGYLTTYNADGKMTASLGTIGRDGFLQTFNADGKETASLGTGEGGVGYLRTFNKHEVETGYFGTNRENDGMAILSDRYGDGGWYESGKK
jgi:hypothetical protein